VVICLERGANDLHGPADATVIPSSLKNPDWFTLSGMDLVYQELGS